MTGIFTKLLCSSLVLTAAGFRARQTRVHSTALATKSADCEALENVNVIGRDVGKAAKLICQFWPPAFGEFPVEDAKQVADIVNQGAEIWEKIGELAKGNRNTSFCWKRAVPRDVLSSFALDSKLAMMNSPVASDCSMRFLGKCYGNCPSDLKPMAFLGGLVPLCTSKCANGKLSTPCGLGCASGWGTCASTLVDQVGAAAQAVGAVSSYMSGQPLDEVVDHLLGLVDFFADTMMQVVALAKKVYEEFPRSVAEFGVIIALVQYVIETAQELGKDFQYLYEQFQEALELFMEILDSEWDWKEFNAKFVADVILKHGSTILDAVYEFATVFVFPTCA